MNRLGVYTSAMWLYDHFEGSALMYQASLKVEPPLMQLVYWLLCGKVGLISTQKRSLMKLELHILHNRYMRSDSKI
jgi:hypothetical protein